MTTTAGEAVGAPRIVHVFTSMGRGGSEIRIVDLVTAMGVTVDFVAASGLPGALDGGLRDAGHRVLLERQAVRRLGVWVRMLRSPATHAVHAHLGSAAGFVMVAAWLARVPVRVVGFVSEGIGGRPTLRRSILLALSRFLVRLLATDIVGVSPGSLTHAWSPRWERDARCRIIPTGIDLARVRAQPAADLIDRVDGLVVVNVAREEPSKNRARAITVWSELATQRPTTLLLVGSIAPHERERAVAAEASAPEGCRVLVLGERADVGSVLAVSDVLLVTSQREGLPSVVLESIAAGVPVVGSDLSGIVWIADNLAGVVTVPLSEPDRRWAEAIESVGGAPSDALQRGFESSIFTMQSVIVAHQQLWRIP